MTSTWLALVETTAGSNLMILILTSQAWPALLPHFRDPPGQAVMDRGRADANSQGEVLGLLMHARTFQAEGIKFLVILNLHFGECFQ